MRNEERDCFSFFFEASILPPFWANKTLISSLSDHACNETSHRPTGSERWGQVIPSPKPWPFLSPFRTWPLPTSMLEVSLTAHIWPCQAISLPSLTFSKHWHHQEGICSRRTAQKHGTFPQATPSSCLFRQLLGRPWEGEMDESSFSWSFKFFTLWLVVRANRLLN